VRELEEASAAARGFIAESEEAMRSGRSEIKVMGTLVVSLEAQYKAEKER